MSSAGAFAQVGYGVQVEIQGPPERSSRLSVFFRGLLMIPLWLLVIPIGLCAMVAIFLNYFGVLFTGRAAFVGFLSGALRYMTRLQAFAFYLTDQYPPFSLGDDANYPVRVVVEHPARVHRWRVFSYLLAIPQIIVLYVLVIVAALATFCAWWAIMFTGHYPSGLYGITSAAVRYQARVNGYLYLITEGYPPFSLD
jgi:uncharacterized membrane protein